MVHYRCGIRRRIYEVGVGWGGVGLGGIGFRSSPVIYLIIFIHDYPVIHNPLLFLFNCILSCLCCRSFLRLLSFLLYSCRGKREIQISVQGQQIILFEETTALSGSETLTDKYNVPVYF